MASQNAIGSDKPIQVALGGTGTATNTQYGVLVGAGTGAIQTTAAGTTGQLLVATTSSNPAFAATATGDFTFTSSTAGATRTFTVTNTDNSNTASSALIKTVTGGASSGDAVFQASTTATVWSMGVDNSVTVPTADTFVIAQGTALGTNNVMSVATTGEINYPLTPAFYAYNSIQDDDVTGDATLYTVICDTEIYDQSSDYDNTTGIFTAPVAGRYLFTAMITALQIGAGHTQGQVIITTTSVLTYVVNVNYAVIRDSGNNIIAGGSVQTNMAAGDTARLQFIVAGSTKTVDVDNGDGFTYFSGYLIC